MANHESKYLPEYCDKARDLCATHGTFNGDLGKAFGVSGMTIGRWRKANPEFDEAIKAGMIDSIPAAVNALYRKAIGYSHEDVKIFVAKDKDGNNEVIKVPYIKHYPPSSVALVFYLKNVAPKDWQDRHEISHSGKVDFNIIEPEPPEESEEEDG